MKERNMFKLYFKYFPLQFPKTKQMKNSQTLKPCKLLPGERDAVAKLRQDCMKYYRYYKDVLDWKWASFLDQSG